ncbi:nucleotide-binding domain-containing protein [Acaromyces ingoldii]|uniref:NADPH:adrenodoxin oxidoreductase, mitochondrial n=1 Tax=Acaromyces ingoldii TaxID=215250 RepID=A0A316YH36_9BASI|nr:nucleotide-binding domain-containing protein [Acaromyces ingoldii]PWN87928.1 nucleotide-binding domain-containing protein [Acaromyces ingoldii]
MNFIRAVGGHSWSVPSPRDLVVPSQTLFRSPGPNASWDEGRKEQETMRWTLVRQRAPLKLAVIGSGPSAFYSAARVLSSLRDDEQAEVHLYERLPTPNGLVRYGVAPDHPEVKNVENKFAQVAADPRLRFFGNVDVVSSSSQSSFTAPSDQYDYPDAHKLALSELLPHYTHLLLAYGSSLARPLSLSPAPLGVHSALDFVNWYNGHPASHDARFLARNPHRRIDVRRGTEHATIVGAGNVALDVARVLLRGARGPADDGFARTDVPEPVLAHLASRLADLKRVDVVARRGAAQVAFTNKELREMMDLGGATRFERPSDADLALAKTHVDALAEPGQARIRKRLLTILEKGSRDEAATTTAERTWALRFFASPGSASATASSVTTTSATTTTAATTTAATSLARTGERFTTPTDLVITSVGYKGAPLAAPSSAVPPAAPDADTDTAPLIPWDAQRGIVPNVAGRVARGTAVVPGLYVSGWLATGPVGVIASTRLDANTIADAILDDWRAQRPTLSSSSSSISPGSVPESLASSSTPIVDWAGWTRLDDEERRRGKALGKLREKVLCESVFASH